MGKCTRLYVGQILPKNICQKPTFNLSSNTNKTIQSECTECLTDLFKRGVSAHLTLNKA